MKSRLVHFLRCTAFVIGSLLTSRAGAQDKELDRIVGTFQHYYNTQQFDSIYSLLSDRVHSMVTPQVSMQSMKALYGQMGKLAAFSFAKVEDSITYYHMDFNKQPLQMLVRMGPDKKLDAMRFAPEKKRDDGLGSSGVLLNTATGTLHGTLSVPANADKVPVVLLIAGSGPTDRDGNNNMGLKTDAYKMIADSLQAAGIACLRYDKRGVGESAEALKDESAITFDDIVNDAIGFAELLKRDNRFSSIIVAGHSEGSLIGMIVARKENVKKYISIAGAGEAAEKVLLAQIKAQSPAEAVDAAIIIDSLKKGSDVKHVPSALSMLFRPTIQPYMRSWLKYDPQAEIKKLKMPILIIQGTTDLQVSEENGSLLKKAAPKAQLVIINGMNHILKDAPADRQANFATYAQGALPLDKEFLKTFIGFIKA